jgi:hypothetical protein
MVVSCGEPVLTQATLARHKRSDRIASRGTPGWNKGGCQLDGDDPRDRREGPSARRGDAKEQ